MQRPAEIGADTHILIATRFVAARRAAVALPDYPGPLPASIDFGYRCQDAAISLWPDRVAGWKVGFIAPERRETGGDERLVGPIFDKAVVVAAADVIDVPVFVGGFAAVEAEYVFRLAADAPAGKTDWTNDDAAALVDTLHAGVELAGSPLATINDLGPAVVVSDFGNNAGLILGAAIADWRQRMAAELVCSVAIDGHEVGRGGAASIAGGPLAALAFALSLNARRGRPLRAGMLVTTGAATGIHAIVAGETALIDFGEHGRIACRAVEATADHDDNRDDNRDGGNAC
jgi:2-keto-4-pentenoate hydratase